MVDRVSVLFVGTGSLTAEEVVAVRVAVPSVNAVVVTWNFMSAPLARPAMVMMSCPLEKVTPVGTVVTCRSDGRVRIAWTLVAVFGPRFLAATPYTAVPLTFADAGPVRIICKSALAVGADTVMLCVGDTAGVPVPLAAWIVKLYVPAVVGVPLRVPVEAIVRPGGSEPLARV